MEYKGYTFVWSAGALDVYVFKGNVSLKSPMSLRHARTYVKTQIKLIEKPPAYWCK